MNKIEVPYLPISGFDSSTVSKYFSSEDNDPDEVLMPSINTADGDLPEEIALILIGMGMEKYFEVFQKQHIFLDTFLQLGESDLEEIGITDPDDKKIIIKNLKVHQRPNNDCVVPENHVEDLKIAKNISHQLLVLQNYCAYIELQMKKYKFIDYKINSEESACLYLKSFAEAALLQSKILCDSIYGQDNYDSIIDKIFKGKDLVLPKALQRLVPRRKAKWKLYCCKLMTAVGISSAVILIGRYIMTGLKNK